VGPFFGDPPAIEHDDSRKWRRALDVRRAVSNVVIEAAVCHDHVADEANRIAENIAANVPA
jgi:hypothetical protein